MSTKPRVKHYDLLGVRIDAVTMARAIELIIKRAQTDDKPVYVVKPYVEFLDLAAKDQGIRQLLNQAWLSLPDAVSTQWAVAYLYGGKRTFWRVISLGAQIIFRPQVVSQIIPEKFGGSNFTWKLLEDCAAQEATVYLIGSPIDSDISVTARVISERLPGIRLVGMWSGSLNGKSGPGLRKALRREAIEADLAADLKAKQPDVILVGMGFPLQEELMAKLLPQLDHGVLIGEGGTFDYDSFGGKRRKAPLIIQKVGLEWLWRLLIEPRRWRRQLAIPRVIWRVYQQGRNG